MTRHRRRQQVAIYSRQVTDEPELPHRCYLICTVQRAGSWLLSHALPDTGVAGIPAE